MPRSEQVLCETPPPHKRILLSLIKRSWQRHSVSFFLLRRPGKKLPYTFSQTRSYLKGSRYPGDQTSFINIIFMTHPPNTGVTVARTAAGDQTSSQNKFILKNAPIPPICWQGTCCCTAHGVRRCTCAGIAHAYRAFSCGGRPGECDH